MQPPVARPIKWAGAPWDSRLSGGAILLSRSVGFFPEVDVFSRGTSGFAGAKRLIMIALWGPLFAAAQQATEADVARFCSRQSAPSEQLVCMHAFLRAEADVRVLEFCARIAADAEKLRCAKLFAGRSFSDTILLFCQTRALDAARLLCLEQSPSNAIPRRAGACESRRVRLGLEDVLTAIREGRTYRAEQLLREVLAEIQ